MDLGQHDFREAGQLADLLHKIDHLDEAYVLAISEEIFQKQPFFMTVLLGFRMDVSPEELEELMKAFFLIWEYFKQDKGIQAIQVSQVDFEKVQKRRIKMLKYAEGETDQKSLQNIYAHDFQRLKSKALFSAILTRFSTRPVLVKMNSEKKGIILMGVKSFIECFETIRA